jgi:spore germination protein
MMHSNIHLIFFYLFCTISFFLVIPAAFAKGARDTASSKTSTETDIISPPEFTPAYERKNIDGDPVSFHEIWGYVIQSQTDALDFDFPLTDIGLFAANINSYGELINVPDRTKIAGFTGHVHLVIVCDSKSLTHFILDPEYAVRNNLLQQIAKAADPFDGIQLDLEYMPARDHINFLSFISDVKKASGNKPISVCVPARIRKIEDDVYPYREIGQLADRVIVMAYDEHWANGNPGPIASLEWCEKVADYATKVIPKQKIVMGMPFYGRTWADANPANGWYYTSINRLLKENDIDKIERENSIPYFTYKTEVTVTGWFEDSYSLVQKCRLYNSKGITNVSFWRIGQEDPDFWQWVTIQ